MFDIRSLFSKGKTPLSSSEISARIRTAQAEMQTVRTAISQMEAARPKVLLEADDRAAEEHDIALAAHRRQLDRLAAAVDELEREKGEAEARERVTALDKLERETTAKVKEGLALLDAYERHAREIAGILDKFKAIETDIAAANTRLLAARRPFIDGPESIARFLPEVEVPDGMMVPVSQPGKHMVRMESAMTLANRLDPTMMESRPVLRAPVRLPPLVNTVCLPPARLDPKWRDATPALWPKAASAL